MQTGRKSLDLHIGLHSLYWTMNKGWIRRIGGLNHPIQPTLLTPDYTGHPHPHSKMISTIQLNLSLELSHLLCTEHRLTPNRSPSTAILSQFLCLNHHSSRTLHLGQHLILHLVSHII
uniref:Uncharacterized protein n=1 Tax=Arundo donax TaxID=35708 RepID=A0A0A9BDL6_ARUDO